MHPLIAHALLLAVLALACGETPDATTTHTHATSSSTGADSTGASSTGDAAALVAEYCACMLEQCHDRYHATWGEDHLASEAMCAAAAEAAPSVGVPASSGDSLECRLHHCLLGHDDPAACDSALGGGACS